MSESEEYYCSIHEKVVALKNVMSAWRIIRWRMSKTKIPSLYSKIYTDKSLLIAVYLTRLNEGVNPFIACMYEIQATLLELVLCDDEPLISRLAGEILRRTISYGMELLPGIDPQCMRRLVDLLKSNQTKHREIAMSILISAYECCKHSQDRKIIWAENCLQYNVIPALASTIPSKIITITDVIYGPPEILMLMDIADVGDKYKKACIDAGISDYSFVPHRIQGYHWGSIQKSSQDTSISHWINEIGLQINRIYHHSFIFSS